MIGRREMITVPGLNFMVKSERKVHWPDREPEHDVTELVSLSQAGRDGD